MCHYVYIYYYLFDGIIFFRIPARQHLIECVASNMSLMCHAFFLTKCFYNFFKIAFILLVGYSFYLGPKLAMITQLYSSLCGMIVLVVAVVTSTSSSSFKNY